MGAWRLLAVCLIAAQLCAPSSMAQQDDAADTVSPDLLRLKERQRRVEALTELFGRQTRVYRLAYPLLYAAVDLCPDNVRTAGGFTYANAYMFRGAVRSAASALGYTHRVGVVDVVANSAGATAGIRARDQLLAIDDWAAPFGEGAVTLTAAKLRDVLDREGQATLMLKRGGVELEAHVRADFICDIQVLAAPGIGVTAYSDGERVVVYHGMMDFADDSELAAVIAREIANALIPTLGIESGGDDEFALSNFFEWGMEEQPQPGGPVIDPGQARDYGLAADYVGAYLLARAGFDHSKGAQILRRLWASEATGQYSRPDAVRLARLEAAAGEIDAKLAARRPLIPQSGGPPAAGNVAPLESARTPPPAPVAAEPLHAPEPAPQLAPQPAQAAEPLPVPLPAPEVAATPPPERDALEEEAWETTAVEAAPTTRVENTYEAGDPGDYRLGVEPLTDPRLTPPAPAMAGEPMAVAEAEPVSVAIDPPPPSDPTLAAPALPSGELGFSFADWFGRSP
jgi:beta-barrel assembly-enhancing protease